MPVPPRVLLRGAPRTIRSVVADYQRSPNCPSPSSSAVSNATTGDVEVSDASILAKLQGTSRAESNTSQAGSSGRPGPDDGESASSALNTSNGHSNEQEVYGWIRSIRAHKNVAFAEIDDGTARLQSVMKGKGRAEGLTIGSSVKLTGRLQPSRGKGQEMEFDTRELSVLGECDPATYPIQKKSLPLPYLRDHAHLRFRTAHTATVMRVRDGLMREWHDWFEENEFVHVHTPILTSSDCEGAGEVFSLANPPIHHPSSTAPSSSTLSSSSSASFSSATAASSAPSATAAPSAPTPPSHTPKTPVERFFPHTTNLTVSSQLHLEAPTHSLARTYTLSPSFRAEPSLTSRHLSEFYMLEGEVAFVQTLDVLMDLVEDGLRKQAGRIMWGSREGSLRTPSTSSTSVGKYAMATQRDNRHERLRRDLEIIASTQAESEASADAAAAAAETDFEARADRAPLAHLVNLAARSFKRISYTEAIRLCRQYADTGDVVFNKVPTWTEGLGTEHEKWLAGHFDGPVFITHYPRAVKPFYMLPSDADPSFASTYADTKTDTDATTLDAKVQTGDTVACFDLVFPSIGELVGGSLREHRHSHLLHRMQELRMKEEEYQWYLDLRKYGSVPHGGWGMGFDRWVCWVTGVGNVRDVVPFPRWRGNCRY